MEQKIDISNLDEWKVQVEPKGDLVSYSLYNLKYMGIKDGLTIIVPSNTSLEKLKGMISQVIGDFEFYAKGYSRSSESIT